MKLTCLAYLLALALLSVRQVSQPLWAAHSTENEVDLRHSGDTVEIVIGGTLFTTYHFSPEVSKPYFQPLRSAEGTIVTRDFPDGNTIPSEHRKDPALEPNQRPMAFGHGNIDGLDFWGEAAFPKSGSYRLVPGSRESVFGRVNFRKLDVVQGGAHTGTLRAEFQLTGPRGRAIADEIQSYVFGGDPNTRWIDCEITLIANHGSDLTLGDTKEGTFAIRLCNDLSAGAGQIVSSTGVHGAEEIWGRRADWVDVDGTVDGKRLGVVLFESPRSFRHPTYWHVRAYGLLSANPFGWREFTKDPNQDGSWTVQQNRQLTFRYRVLIHHGDYREAKVAEAYESYATQERPQR